MCVRATEREGEKEKSVCTDYENGSDIITQIERKKEM